MEEKHYYYYYECSPLMDSNLVLTKIFKHKHVEDNIKMQCELQFFCLCLYCSCEVCVCVCVFSIPPADECLMLVSVRWMESRSLCSQAALLFRTVLQRFVSLRLCRSLLYS